MKNYFYNENYVKADVVSVLLKLGLIISFPLVISRIPFATSLIALFYFSFVGLLAFKLSKHANWTERLSSLNLSIPSLLLLGVFSLIVVSVMLNAFSGIYDPTYVKALILSFLLYSPILLSNHLSWFNVRFEWLVAGYAVLMLLLGVFELVVGVDVFPSRFSNAGLSQAYVASGTFFNENDFAAAIVTLLPVVMYCGSLFRPLKVLSYLLFFIAGAILALSVARASQLVFVFYLLVYGSIFVTRFKVYQVVVYSFTILFMLFPLLFLFGDILLSRLDEIGRILGFIAGGDRDNSGSIRIQLMVDGWQLAVSKFWGYGGLQHYVVDADLVLGRKLHDLHFFWVELFVMAGVVPAALLLISYIGMIAVHGIRLLAVTPGRSYSLMVVLMAVAFFVTAHGASSTLKLAWVWLIFLISFNFPPRGDVDANSN